MRRARSEKKMLGHRAVALVWVALLTGCAGTLARAAHPAVSGAIQSLDEPQNREAIGEVMKSPEIGEGARVLAAGVGEGVVRGVADDEVAERLSVLVGRMTNAALQEFIEVFRTQMAPAVSEALRDELQANLRPIVKEMSKEITAGVVAGLAQASRRQSEDSMFGKMRRLARGSLWLVLLAGVCLVAFLGMGVVLFIRRLRKRRQVASALSSGMRAQVEVELRRLLRDPDVRQALRRELEREQPGAEH